MGKSREDFWKTTRNTWTYLTPFLEDIFGNEAFSSAAVGSRDVSGVRVEGDDKKMTIQIAAPGCSREDVEVTLDLSHRLLKVTTKGFTPATTKFRVSPDVTHENISVTVKDGLITIVIESSLKTTEVKIPVQIPVK